jgi:hypothetical protein
MCWQGSYACVPPSSLASSGITMADLGATLDGDVNRSPSETRIDPETGLNRQYSRGYRKIEYRKTETRARLKEDREV